LAIGRHEWIECEMTHLQVIYDNQTFSTTPKNPFSQWEAVETLTRRIKKPDRKGPGIAPTSLAVYLTWPASWSLKSPQEISRLLTLRCQLLIFD